MSSYLIPLLYSNVVNRMCLSVNGWTDSEIVLEWMKKDFEPSTREKAGSCTQVLLMDGHSSHYSPDVLKYALDHNIRILGYPPHCTHALQGLNVVCFAKMKDAWKEEISKFEQINKRSVGKGDFAYVFGSAFLKAFKKDTVEAAFRATGVYPFDRDAIKAKQMKPSLLSSVNGSFPLPQTSPVCVLHPVHIYPIPHLLTSLCTPSETPMPSPSSYGTPIMPPWPSWPHRHSIDTV